METQSNFEKLNFHREFRDSFIHSKENEIRQSEQRIRFFLALVTGTLAVLGIIFNNESLSTNITLIAEITLPILFFYGILTFSQIIWSSHVITNIDTTIGILNRLIKDLDNNLKEKIDSALRYEAHIIIILKHIKGTFAQYMYLTEGLLVAGFVFLIGFDQNSDTNSKLIISSIAVRALLITVALLYIWSNRVKNGVSRKKQIENSNTNETITVE